MNSVIYVSLPLTALSVAIMLVLPHITPRRYFFAITVPPGFASSEPGRRVLHRYNVRLAVVAALSAAAVCVLAGSWPAAAIVASNLVPIAAGFVLFLMGRNEVRRFSIGSPVHRQAELSTRHDHLPPWVLAALPPFAVPLAAAAWLRAHWAEIPTRFPVHWDLQGNANGWSEKTARGIYGPLLFEAGIMLFLLLLGLLMFYGSRRGPQRLAVLKIEIAAMYFLAYTFTAVSLLPLMRLPMIAYMAPTLIFVVGVLVWSYRLVSDPDMPVDPTPDSCWRLGSIYYNPRDPAVFVQKRIGFGYTFNFGNHLTWVLMGMMVAVFVGLTLIIK